MATISLPYKLQVFIPDDLRQDLKDLAHAQKVTLQELVNTALRDTVKDRKQPKRERHAAVST